MNNLVNEKSGISPEMAVRLEKAFGSEAGFWLRLQTAYDLAQARRNTSLNDIRRFDSEAAER